MSNRFTGVLAPVITPFDDNLLPDRTRFVNHCRWLQAQGCGLAIFGTNSEANSLSVAEKLALLEAMEDSRVDCRSLMPGTGSCALPDSVTLTRAALAAGAGGVLMLPPFYYKGVSDDGLFAYYAEIIQQLADDRLQIYLYHIPQVSGVPLPLSLIERLVKTYPQQIAGIKDSSGDWSNTLAMLEAGWEDFRVFCGSESFLLRTMQHGGAGCISATANVNPAMIVRLFESWSAADAEQQQQRLDQIRQIFQDRPMIPALKGALASYGKDPQWLRVRPPLVGLTAEQFAGLEQAMQQAAFAMPGIGA
ncbi:MAG: dihydrodipicolinate synthase family protein [Gammaproteobacteria bacterium]